MNIILTMGDMLLGSLKTVGSVEEDRALYIEAVPLNIN